MFCLGFGWREILSRRVFICERIPCRMSEMMEVEAGKKDANRPCWQSAHGGSWKKY